MKPHGRDYEAGPVLKRLVDLYHATLILARCLQARGPHTEGSQIIDVHGEDDNQPDMSALGRALYLNHPSRVL